MFFERDLHVSSEAADLAHSLAKPILETHKLDLHDFFDATLTCNQTTRCSDFDQLQELLTAEK